MRTFRGLTSSDFYQLRDQRTELSISSDVLLAAATHISVDDFEASNLPGQLAFLTLVNLSSRWCRKISLSGPNIEIHPKLAPFYSGRLIDEASRIAVAADPFIELTQGDSGAQNRVHVGTRALDAFRVCGRGWLAFGGSAVEQAPKEVDIENPLGALLSACIGVAHSMRVAIGDEDLYESTVVSLWNLETGAVAEGGPKLSPLDLGRVLIVGLGAVGSGIAHSLSFTPVRPEETVLVDEDSVDFPNLNRSPVFFAEDVTDGKKVEVVAATVPGLRPAPNQVGIEDAVRNGVRIDEFDLVIPAANVPSARTTIMGNTPPLMISASTGTQWDAYRQRHIPLQDDCLICRFPLNQPPPTLMCSSGGISPIAAVSEAPAQTGALPFLSLAGSILAVAEICKLSFVDATRASTNRTVLSFRSADLIMASSHRLAKPECSYCVQPQLFDALGTHRRFASYSLPI